MVVSMAPPAGFADGMNGKAPAGSGTAHIGLVEIPTGLEVGLRARVLRGRYAGRSGLIVELPPMAQPVATGAAVLVARVCLDVPPTGGIRGGACTGSGAPRAADAREAEVVTVPQANLKLEGGEPGAA